MGLTLVSHSISFTGAEGTPKCKIGLGRGRDGSVGVYMGAILMLPHLAHTPFAFHAVDHHWHTPALAMSSTHLFTCSSLWRRRPFHSWVCW